jgi:predicted transcriptional regulator
MARPVTRGPTKQFNIRLRDELSTSLNLYAEARGKTKTEIIEAALAQYLKHKMPAVAQR